MNILPISPSSLLGIDIVSAAGLQALAEQASISIGGESSFVQLSGLGQLLSAAYVSGVDLARLSATQTDSSSPALLALADGFVQAANRLNTAVLGVQSGSTSGALVALAAELKQSLNGVTTEVFDKGMSNFRSLSAIGISISQQEGNLTTDSPTLQSAIQNDPTGVEALLRGAINSLGSAVGRIEIQTTKLTMAAIGLTPSTSPALIAPNPGLGVNTESPGTGFGLGLAYLQALGADSLQNAIQLGDLDLVGTGLSGPPEAAVSVGEQAARDSSLLQPLNVSRVSDPSSAAEAAEPIRGASVPSLSAESASRISAKDSTTPTSTVKTMVTEAASPSLLATATTANGVGANMANTGGLAATTAQKSQIDVIDPVRRALSAMKDQAYAALIATYSLNSFVGAHQAYAPQFRNADVPTPVSRAAAVRAI